MKKIIDIQEAESHLSELLKEIMEGGEVIISQNDEPIAELKKIERSNKRELGTLKGKLVVHGDFSDADEQIEEMFDQSKLFPHEKTIN
ncbi:type II toxin-antitoxin system Phd/YefM family antitoxin [Rhodohalobacter sulfatireducens]|uniref:Antitoxin n=1 Tax=Rhodohalobacter sulfatireducens TaxID=2911366 RepID=A0ABS9KA87_9BACT|nr:type II toxin-antitoxin system Phd/YefM family antitoxin [Rhodohalobacter sulfatireducens]MCG2587751.1 type II toxin-antitoxin system Phd/YefM family antitoxin [Rhodohalobacter sulfatireducens]